MLGKKSGLEAIQQFDEWTEKQKGKGFWHKGKEFVHHSGLDHSETAYFRLSNLQKFAGALLLGMLLLGLILNWHATIVIFIAVLTFLYFVDLLFNLFLIYRSFSASPEIKVSSQEVDQISESAWPRYTIFCPLYREWQVLPQFVSAMSSLDYPKSRLQVMLLLEEDDTQTIQQARWMNLPSYFDIVVVPHSLPKTKPKALNYGLKFATGNFVVVYDAEDVPEPSQLKKVILAFRKAQKNVICIQAKLNFYNSHQNVLTRVFTAEYALWFDLVLTGLQSIHAPIPLGGTSNHFKTLDIHQLKGWDSFNVTEDADLGMRLVKKGFRTAMVDSDTQEEANSEMRNWFWQRTRWIKGYMQTYLVHMRAPHHFLKDWSNPHLVTFQLVIGGKILSMFINPFLWLVTISYFAFRPVIGETIESFFPPAVLYMGVFCLVVGNFLYMYYYMVGCAKRGYNDIIKFALLVPIYWLVMSAAAWIALYLLIRKPHHWSKTRHGLHLQNAPAPVVQNVTVDNRSRLVAPALIN